MNYAEYNHHPVRLLISQILGTLASPVFSDPSVSDHVEARYALDKIFAVVKRLSDVLDRTPAQLASAHGLAQLQGGLQQIVNELSAVGVNGGVQNILQASVVVDQQIQYLFWTFTPDSSLPEKSPLPQLMDQHSQVAEAAIRRLVEQRDQISNQLSANSKLAADLQNQFNSMSEGAARERAEAAAAVARIEQAYAEKENERTQANYLSQKNLREEFDSLCAGMVEKADTLISGLTDKKQEAARIVQVVGNIGTTGNYQQIAEKEAIAADLWRKVTVAIFATGIAIALTTFVMFWNHTSTVENAFNIAVRLLYAIAITSPAWYTAKESARHRTNSDKAKQTELELASIGPFIELLPTEKQNSIREELTKKYFGRDITEHSVKAPVETKDIKDLAIAAFDAFGKAK